MAPPLFSWDHDKVSSSWKTMKSRCSMFTCRKHYFLNFPPIDPSFVTSFFVSLPQGHQFFWYSGNISFIPRVFYCVRVSVPSFTVLPLFLSSLFMCKYYLYHSQTRLQILGPGSDLNRCGVNPWKLPMIFTRQKGSRSSIQLQKSKYLEMTFFRTHLHWHCMPLIHCLLCYSLTQITC